MNGEQQPEQQPIEQWAEQCMQVFTPFVETIKCLVTIYGETGNVIMQSFAHALERANEPTQED